MTIKSMVYFLTASLFASVAHANPAYLSGIDESQDAARYRFITTFAGDKATQVDKKTFERSMQQHIKDTFGKNKSLNEAQFILAQQIKNDAEFAQSRAGQIRQTTVRFQSIDSNKDGFIDLHEFQAIGLKSFERYDTNKDGFISAADDQTKIEGDAQEKEGVTLTPRLKGLLTMPTTHDAKGFLALYAEGREKISLADYLKTREEQYQRTDTNKDGKIDNKEYEAEFLSRVDAEIAKAKAAQTQFLKARFAQIDSNKDGKITPAEMQQFAQAYFSYWDSKNEGVVRLDK